MRGALAWRRELASLFALALVIPVPVARAGSPLPPRSPVNLPGGPYGNFNCYPTGIYYPGIGWTGGFQCFPNQKGATPDCGCSSNPGFYPNYGFGGTYISSGIYGYTDAPPSVPVMPSYPATTQQPEPPAPPSPPPVLVVVPAAAAQDNRVYIDINLPADAELYIQGIKMQQTGTVRRFTSPVLDPTRHFTYEIRAVWKENGREVSASRKLGVRAGDQQTITLQAAAANVASAGR